MTTEEHNACKCLLISNTTENTEDSNVVSNSYEERQNSFKRRKKNKGEYKDKKHCRKRNLKKRKKNRGI